MHHIKIKALASLITTFLQTAASKTFQQSLYHNTLYRIYCLGDDSLPKIERPPYYSQHFFTTIKKVINDSPLNPVNMTLKQWYDYLLEEEVTLEVVDDEGRQEPKKCRVELLYPNNSWHRSYHLSRVRGLSTEIRSFNFKLLHQLLPFNERLHQLLPNTQPTCTLCAAQVPESPLHGIFVCVKNNLAAQDMLTIIRHYDNNITAERALLLDINTCDIIYESSVMLILATGMSLIWKNRQIKRETSVVQFRAELQCLASLLATSSTRKLRETGKMISNTTSNFPT